MGKLRMLLGAALALALAMPAAALAASNEQLPNVTLEKGDNRTGTYYVAGQTVTVDGNVEGDVICGAQTVVINGAVGGDVICAGQTITVNGTVGGSVRSVGQVVTINGTVGRNITAGAQNFSLGDKSNVSGEAAVAAQTLVLSGPIARAAYLAGQEMNLKSTIGGDLNYTSEKTPALDKSKVQGQVVRHDWPIRANAEPTPAQRLASLLFWLAAGLAGAALMILTAPRLVRSVNDEMLQRWQASLGWGALALLAIPFLLIMLALTVVGLPAAGVLFALWILTLFTSGLFAGIAVGRILREQGALNRQNMLMAAIIGVPILVVLNWLPVIGGLASFAASAWTLGGMILSANKPEPTT